jgi:hypothetical protein
VLVREAVPVHEAMWSLGRLAAGGEGTARLMERGSSKHGAHLDDEMSREVRGEIQGVPGGRAEEWELAEPAGDDQPAATELLDSAEGERFSRFGRYIGLSALPGDRDALRRSAEALRAPDDVLAALGRLPDETVFHTVAEIWAVLGNEAG